MLILVFQELDDFRDNQEIRKVLFSMFVLSTNLLVSYTHLLNVMFLLMLKVHEIVYSIDVFLPSNCLSERKA